MVKFTPSLLFLLVMSAAAGGCSGESLGDAPPGMEGIGDASTSVSGTASSASSSIAPPPSSVGAPAGTDLDEDADDSLAGDLENRPLIANHDSYTIESDIEFDSGSTQGLGSNDIVDLESATFSIITEPKHGELMLGLEGAFTYQPEPGFVGTDSFVYEVADDTRSATATTSITVYDATETSSGFTAIVPSADSKLIYVSSSVGSDDNDCLSEATPCQSLSEAFEKMRREMPDHVYLKRGDVWHEQSLNNVQSGRSEQEPAVVAFYGEDGDRPKLESSGNILNVANGGKYNIHFIGLELSAYKLDPNSSDFTGNPGDSANVRMIGNNENLLFEDIIFNHIEVILQNWEGGTPSNFAFRRNIWTGKYYNRSSYERNSRPSNMYASGVDGLILEENVIDYGGWHPEVSGAGGNMFNHNLYIQYSTVGNGLVIRNNIITRASSHGVHGRPGGLFENNFFGRNAISLQMGYNGHPLKEGTRASAINNVITEGASMAKGNDACRNNGLCTPAVWGLQIDEPGQGEFFVKGNIVHSISDHDDQWQNVYSRLIKSGLTVHQGDKFTYLNNVTWRWESEEQGTDSSYQDPGRTLGDYNQSLGGSNDFDEFMNTVKERPLQTWDARYSAQSINDFIREGFTP